MDDKNWRHFDLVVVSTMTWFVSVSALPPALCISLLITSSRRRKGTVETQMRGKERTKADQREIYSWGTKIQRSGDVETRPLKKGPASLFLYSQLISADEARLIGHLWDVVVSGVTILIHSRASLSWLIKWCALSLESGVYPPERPHLFRKSAII